MEIIKLLELAEQMRDRSYCPYSGFAVGAALLCADGSVFTGCNIENSAFGPTICAERTAIFKAVSEGHRDLIGIAIMGGPQGVPSSDFCAPCGVCRQVMAEFCDPDVFRIYLADGKGNQKEYPLRMLLPEGFSGLKKEA